MNAGITIIGWETNVIQSKIVLIERNDGDTDTPQYDYYVNGKQYHEDSLKQFLFVEKKYLRVKDKINVLEYWLKDSHGNLTALYRYVDGAQVDIPENAAERTMEDIL